jgi:uncharacterized protein YecE (DUF72 family)
MIWIGTSGFAYPEWKGKFYPTILSAKKMLAYYGRHFPTTESNYTFRTIPSAKTITNWSAETPANFRFSLKAPQEITHFKKLRGCDKVLTEFWEVARTLEKKLGMILFQLPPYLRKDIPLLDDFITSLPRGMQSAFEFRHESWFGDELFATLRAKNAALCIADSEKLTTPAVATADFGYFRLRDEGYVKKDIARWAELITGHGKKAKDVYVYFKHEESGIGPKFAAELMKILGPDAAQPDAS